MPKRKNTRKRGLEKRHDYFDTSPPLDTRRKYETLQIGLTERVPPEVGIFDEPTRCFKVNHEWWSIIAGMVSWLTDPIAWQNATDETYIAIQEIRKFMLGSECCMDCTELQECLETSSVIIELQQQIAILQDTILNGSPTSETLDQTVPELFTPEDQAETIGGDLSEPPVGEDCNFDEAWGVVNRLINYIHNTNVDFLQNIAQATNITAQASRAISAIPFIGLFPADEAIGLADWYANEALTEYTATVDEELLRKTKCELFCMSTNCDTCGLSFADLLDYFSAKVPISAGQFVDTFANLIRFALTGTFSGDDYFYYMCYFQLAIAFAGERWFNQRGTANYAREAAAGKLEASDVWMALCDDCVEGLHYVEFDFTVSQYDFTVLVGQHTSNGFAGADTDADPNFTQLTASIEKSYTSSVLPTVRGIGIEVFRQDTQIEGQDNITAQVSDDSGATWSGLSLNFYGVVGANTSHYTAFVDPVSANKIRLISTVRDDTTDNPASIITKCRVWYTCDSPISGIPTSIIPVGTFNSDSDDYWQ